MVRVLDVLQQKSLDLSLLMLVFGQKLCVNCLTSYCSNLKKKLKKIQSGWGCSHKWHGITLKLDAACRNCAKCVGVGKGGWGLTLRNETDVSLCISPYMCLPPCFIVRCQPWSCLIFLLSLSLDALPTAYGSTTFALVMYDTPVYVSISMYLHRLVSVVSLGYSVFCRQVVWCCVTSYFFVICQWWRVSNVSISL